MYITDIELQNFRNYTDLHLAFHPNVNLLTGDNAQGKTNLLEAIYLTAMGKSFRTGKDSEMIQFGADYGRIKVHGERAELDTTVEMILSKDARKAVKIDGVKIKKASQMLNHLYMVVFSPEDLKIVKDEPEKRRRFMDRELCQLRPRYYEALSAYRRVLLQRNAYLKEYAVDPSIIDIWDMQLSHYGAEIMCLRAEFVVKLNQISRVIHNSITGDKENLHIAYHPNMPLTSSVREQEAACYERIKKSWENDSKQRTTTRGPHKDDLEFLVDDVNVRAFGSQGQQRTAALALKLAELQLIREEIGEDAILLLDDVMSELDLQRQAFLIQHLADIQLFITTTEIAPQLKNALPEGKTFHVHAGKIEET